MKRYCSVTHCHGVATGYSALCSKHSKNQIRHGHPGQLSVKVHELRPYVAVVQQSMDRNPDNAAWRILRERWEATVEQAGGIVREFEAGKAGNRIAIDAARHLQALARDVPGDSVIQTVMGLFLMADARPQRFVSDRGFDFQLVRRVRGLAATNAGTYWDASTGKQKKVYRDLAPRVAEVFAQFLKAAFGAAGLQFAGLERSRTASAAKKRKELAEAMEALT